MSLQILAVMARASWGCVVSQAPQPDGLAPAGHHSSAPGPGALPVRAAHADNDVWWRGWGWVAGEFRFPPILCVGQKVIPSQEGRWNAVHGTACRGAVQRTALIHPQYQLLKMLSLGWGRSGSVCVEIDCILLPQLFV